MGVRQMLDEHFQGRRDHSARIWRLLIFELWHRNFLETFRTADASCEPYRVTSVLERSDEFAGRQPSLMKLDPGHSESPASNLPPRNHPPQFLPSILPAPFF